MYGGGVRGEGGGLEEEPVSRSSDGFNFVTWVKIGNPFSSTIASVFSGCCRLFITGEFYKLGTSSSSHLGGQLPTCALSSKASTFIASSDTVRFTVTIGSEMSFPTSLAEVLICLFIFNCYFLLTVIRCHRVLLHSIKINVGLCWFCVLFSYRCGSCLWCFGWEQQEMGEKGLLYCRCWYYSYIPFKNSKCFTGNAICGQLP